MVEENSGYNQLKKKKKKSKLHFSKQRQPTVETAKLETDALKSEWPLDPRHTKELATWFASR